VEPEAAFNIPLTDDENRAVLIARSRSEIIHKAPGTPTTAPAAEVAAATTTPATKPAEEPQDRQLQRALEMLIAYQAFGPSRDFAVDVTTARPGVTASLPPTTAPSSNPGAPATTPDVPQ
jgi:hypothetical protein